jgi:hypothetical protein
MQRVHPRPLEHHSALMLNHGIRWEYFPYPPRIDRGLERYDPTINKVLICGMGSVPGNCGRRHQQETFFAPAYFGLACYQYIRDTA